MQAEPSVGSSGWRRESRPASEVPTCAGSPDADLARAVARFLTGLTLSLPLDRAVIFFPPRSQLPHPSPPRSSLPSPVLQIRRLRFGRPARSRSPPFPGSPWCAPFPVTVVRSCGRGRLFVRWSSSSRISLFLLRCFPLSSFSLPCVCFGVFALSCVDSSDGGREFRPSGLPARAGTSDPEPLCSIACFSPSCTLSFLVLFK